MLGSPIREVLEPRKLVVAPPEATVAEAARLMMEGKVGAVLVVRKDGRLEGIFTERDAVCRVMAVGRDPAATTLAEVMTLEPKTVSPDESFGYALLLMYDNGFRHAPVVENGRPIGMISARHALDPDLEEFTAESARRRHIRRRA
jgi:CBS domain-containing protein